jgi:hypothetical protein
MKKELGKILIDMAKLVIGGVILAGLMRQDIPPVFLFTVGKYHNGDNDYYRACFNIMEGKK